MENAKSKVFITSQKVLTTNSVEKRYSAQLCCRPGGLPAALTLEWAP